jgi:hypothetical protein
MMREVVILSSGLLELDVKSEVMSVSLKGTADSKSSHLDVFHQCFCLVLDE